MVGPTVSALVPCVSWCANARDTRVCISLYRDWVWTTAIQITREIIQRGVQVRAIMIPHKCTLASFHLTRGTEPGIVVTAVAFWGWWVPGPPPSG